MAIRSELSILFFGYCIAIGQTSAPFPQGYFMANQETIIQDNWIASREPWFPAIIRNDEHRFGISVGATSFYDRMDNLENRSLYSLYGGGWFTWQQIRLNCTYTQFEAFGIYYENILFLSAGIHLWRQLNLSLNLRGSRTGIYDRAHSFRTNAGSGISLRYKFSVVSITTTADHLTLKKYGGTAADPPVQLKIGIHTHYNPIGAQGMVISVTPDAQYPVRFILGEEFRFSKHIGVNASIANNPFLVGIGFFAGIRNGDITVGLMNHPELGWSRGSSVSFGK